MVTKEDLVEMKKEYQADAQALPGIMAKLAWSNWIFTPAVVMHAPETPESEFVFGEPRKTVNTTIDPSNMDTSRTEGYKMVVAFSSNLAAYFWI